MAISAEQVQIAIVQEAVYGTTPATPVFQVMPLTGEGVVAEVASTTSAMMTDDRQVSDLITTSISAAGDITTELAITPAMKVLLESAMAEDFVTLNPAIVGLPPSDESMIGNTQLSYTIEKRFPDPATPGSYLYHRAAGCVTNTASFAVTPDGPATISFGIIGKEFTNAETIISGATYVEPSSPTVLRGTDVSTIDIEGLSIAANCFGAFGWEINNNYRGILCLGYLGNKEMALGQAEVTCNMNIYFASNELHDALLAQTEISIDFEMQNALDPGEYFASYIPRAKLSQNNILAGGLGEDVIEDIVVQGLFNSDGSNDTLGLNNADKTTMRVVVGTGAITT